MYWRSFILKGVCLGNSWTEYVGEYSSEVGSPIWPDIHFERRANLVSLLGEVFTLLGMWWLYRGKFVTAAHIVFPLGIVLCLLGIILPQALVFPNKAWMTLAEGLSYVTTRIIPVTHVDYTARVQTVRRETNPLYWEILSAFERKTGCPVIVNTSFNVRGEPIVCSPEDSHRCFVRTEMDFLILETCVLDKRELN